MFSNSGYAATMGKNSESFSSGSWEAKRKIEDLDTVIDGYSAVLTGNTKDCKALTNQIDHLENSVD